MEYFLINFLSIINFDYFASNAANRASKASNLFSSISFLACNKREANKEVVRTLQSQCFYQHYVAQAVYPPPSRLYYLDDTHLYV